MRRTLIALLLVLAGVATSAQQFPGTLPAHVIVDSCSGCGGAASFADNGTFTAGTTAVTPMAAVVDETATNTVTEDHAGAPRMTASRILYVDLKNTQANATALKVDGSAVTQPVSATSLPLPTNAAIETGGNLATVKTNTDKLDIALSALRDAITAASPNNKTLADVYTAIAEIHTALGGTTVPAKVDVVGGLAPDGTFQPFLVTGGGSSVVVSTRPTFPRLASPFTCNALRRTNCQ